MVWEEVNLAFSYSKKIRLYNDIHRKRNRHADAILLILVCFTSISFLINNIFPIIVSIMSSVAVILKQLLPIFRQSENELSILDNAADFFAKYLVDMEQIFYNLTHGIESPDECSNAFFKLRKSSTDYYTIVNQYYRKFPKKLDKQIKKELDEYAKRFKTSEDS